MTPHSSTPAGRLLRIKRLMQEPLKAAATPGFVRRIWVEYPGHYGMEIVFKSAKGKPWAVLVRFTPGRPYWRRAISNRITARKLVAVAMNPAAQESWMRVDTYQGQEAA